MDAAAKTSGRLGRSTVSRARSLSCLEDEEEEEELCFAIG
jgi:hypothetical protein